MKQLTLLIMLLFMVVGAGCSTRGGSAAAGALGGAAVGAGAYEYNANRQMKQLDEDYAAGRIDRREYEIRKDQIERMSIIK